MFAYVGSIQTLEDLKDPTSEIRKEAGHSCGSFLRKGEVFACVGLSHNLKDLKEHGRLQGYLAHKNN